MKASIIGVTGYAGIELFRLLNNHSEIESVDLYSRSHQGELLRDIYPQFSDNRYILKKYKIDDIVDSDIVFTALPHGISQDIVIELFKKGLMVIDLSGDFRYKNPMIYEEWYDIKHRYPEYLIKAVYGLADINKKEIKGAKLIANPGCYPTASLLGIWPAFAEGIIKKQGIIIDAKSGISGAGSGVKKITQFTEIDENISAYAIGTHRHTSEIENALKNFSTNSSNIQVSFTPHLIPVKRGIMTTIYANLEKDINKDSLIKIYKNYYSEKGFIQLVKKAETKYVVPSNNCHISLEIDERLGRLVIISVIDNLIKGAAGQAVQNMNIALGFSEKTGLEAAGIFP